MDTRFWYLHNYRALPMFGLPLLLFAADELLRGLIWATTGLVRWSRANVSLAAATRPRLTPAALPAPPTGEAPRSRGSGRP
jgi:hypothetical protein